MASKKSKEAQEKELPEVVEAFICEPCNGTGITDGLVGSTYAPLCVHCNGKGTEGDPGPQYPASTPSAEPAAAEPDPEDEE